MGRDRMKFLYLFPKRPVVLLFCGNMSKFLVLQKVTDFGVIFSLLILKREKKMLA